MLKGQRKARKQYQAFKVLKKGGGLGSGLVNSEIVAILIFVDSGNEMSWEVSLTSESLACVPGVSKKAKRNVCYAGW